MGEQNIGDSDAHSLGELSGVVNAGPRRKNYKFFASMPARDVLNSAVIDQYLPDFLEHLIAEPVAILVINVFKVVYVHHDARQRIA